MGNNISAEEKQFSQEYAKHKTVKDTVYDTVDFYHQRNNP